MVESCFLSSKISLNFNFVKHLFGNLALLKTQSSSLHIFDKLIPPSHSGSPKNKKKSFSLWCRDLQTSSMSERVTSPSSSSSSATPFPVSRPANTSRMYRSELRNYLKHKIGCEDNNVRSKISSPKLFS